MSLDAILHQKETPWWRQFQQAPCQTLAKTLYSWRRRLAVAQLIQQSPASANDITVVCISDTHNSQPEIPPGDILVHAGDLTQGGTAAELQAQLDWLDAQPHAHKFVIAGNHDVILDPVKSAEFGFPPEARETLRWGSLIYLQHSSRTVEVRGRAVSMYGHPSTQKQGNWAFQYDKDAGDIFHGPDVFRNTAPMDFDILVTHMPPLFHLDAVGWGEAFLIREVGRVKPKLHIFGHVHAGHGKDVLMYDAFEREYEDISTNQHVLLGCIKMICLLLLMLITGVSRYTPQTIMVNAVVAGGLRDESVRKAQTVCI